MVTYDFSGEDVNPWAPETWSLTEQGKFLKRMSAKYGPEFGMMRAKSFAAQAGSKVGATQPKERRAPFQVIVQNRYLKPPITDITLGFGLAGLIEADTQWTLPVVTSRIQWPSSKPSEALCDTAPTGDSVLTLSTVSNLVLCTVVFSAGSTVGNFNWSAPTSYITQPGDLLYLFAELPQDPTFAGVNLAFIGRKLPS